MVQLNTACLPTSADTLTEDDWESNINCPSEKLAWVPPGLRPWGTELASQSMPESYIYE